MNTTLTMAPSGAQINHPTTTTGGARSGSAFRYGFEAASAALAGRGSRSARVERRGASTDWSLGRGQALLNWRSLNASLGYAEQEEGLAEVRRGWNTAVSLRRGRLQRGPLV